MTMSRITCIVLIAIILGCCHAQIQVQVSGSTEASPAAPAVEVQFDEQMPPALDLGATLIAEFLNTDLVQSKLRHVYDFIDFKIRLVRFIKSVLTRENFVLVHNFLDLVGRGSNFIASFLPEGPSDGAPVQCSTSTSQIGITAGHGGFLNGVVEAIFPTIPVNQPESPVYESTKVTAPVSAPLSAPVAEVITRVDRDARDLSEEEQKLLDEHREDVLQVAKLIYNS